MIWYGVDRQHAQENGLDAGCRAVCAWSKLNLFAAAQILDGEVVDDFWGLSLVTSFGSVMKASHREAICCAEFV